MRYSRLILLWLCVGSLSACQGMLPYPQARDSSPPADNQAEALARSGDYSSAMKRYQQLAQASTAPDRYRLQAADMALKSGDSQAAQQLANTIRPGELTDADHDRYLLLNARLDLNAGDAQSAMLRLDHVSAQRLATPDAKNYHILRASALNQLGSMRDSAVERVALGKLLSSPEDLQRNNDAIFDALGRLTDRDLQTNQPPPPDTLGGWMSLTHILKTMPGAGLAAALSDWRQTYPGHPANGAFLQSYLTASPQAEPDNAVSGASGASQRDAIPHGPFYGVLLPLSGSFAAASEAIRNGMLAAQEANPDPTKPQLHFSDSTAGEIYPAYRRLSDAGASAVVGPLIKGDIESLAKGSDFPVPVLALNQVADVHDPKIVQFGLTPEQELEQVTSLALKNGTRNALILAPDSAFGQRLTQHLHAYLPSAGGSVLDIRRYRPQAIDLPVLLASLPFAGSDTFILLIADPKDARAIMSSIGPSPLSPLPVYAFSQAYDGAAGNPRNAVLNAVTLCDMPWIMNPDEGGARSYHALAQRFAGTAPENLKLIAMGLDAYSLIDELPRYRAGQGSRLRGATGELTLQADNRIYRQLTCARFNGATPVRLGGSFPGPS